MANIQIKRKHNLGVEVACTRVEEVAKSLESDLNVKYEWKGNKLLFQRSGASGIINVGDDIIDLDIKLGLMLSPMKGKIEETVRQKLDAALSHGDGTGVA